MENFEEVVVKANSVLQSWLELTDTKIVLPSEKKLDDIGKVLNLTGTELEKLSKFTSSSRMFLIHQDAQSIAVELSIGGLVGIVRILSARGGELKIYQEVLQQYPGHPDDWINPLYKALNLN